MAKNIIASTPQYHGLYPHLPLSVTPPPLPVSSQTIIEVFHKTANEGTYTSAQEITIGTKKVIAVRQ